MLVACNHGCASLDAVLAVPAGLCVDRDPLSLPRQPLQASANSPKLHTAPCEIVAKGCPHLRSDTKLLGGALAYAVWD